MQKNIIRIDSACEKTLSDLTAECYVLNVGVAEDFCRKFIDKATQNDKIVLFYGENAVTYAKKYNADGVIIDIGAEGLKDKMPKLRQELGLDKFVGLFTRNRRHEAMLVSEAEPDFIVFKVWKDGFENIKELTDWYVDFFLIQSAAWIVDNDVDCSLLNTDFIIKE